MHRYPDVVRRAQAAGLGVRGACRLAGADLAATLPQLESESTLVLLGFTGSLQWGGFAASPEAADGRPDPLDRWSRHAIDALAADVGARAFYPSGTPQLPFQRLALRSEPVHTSPLGLLIHPEWGLWHAYRGALAFDELADVPTVPPTAHPCTSCAARPCLSACPVDAFGAGGFDVAACVAHVAGERGADCRNLGCRARRACPVGTEAAYLPEQQAFHMAAFLRACRPPG